MAEAADWSLKSSLSETLAYDDNFSLSPMSDGGVYSAATALSLDLMARTPTCQFNLTGAWSYPLYAGEGADEVDSDLSGSYGFRFEKRSEQTTFSLAASVVSASTRTTELTDSGEIDVNGTRTTYLISGAIKHQISRIDALSLSAVATMVDFSGETAGLTPFNTVSLDGGWARQLSRRSDFTTNVAVSRYEPDSDSTSPASTTYSGTVGLSAKVTKRLSMSGSVGARATQPDGEEFAFGGIGNLNLSYKQKNTSYALFASQSASPSSLGDIQTTTSFGFTINHAINELSDLSLTTRYSTYSSIDSDRNLLIVSPTYSRELTRNARAQIGYEFTQSEESSGSAISNYFFIRFSRDFEIFR